MLGLCAALSLVALVLPAPVRDPVAAAMRRSLLAPMLALQERAELSRRAILTHDAIVIRRDSVAMEMMSAAAVGRENDRLRALLGLGSRLQWGFVPAEALHGRGVRDEFGLTLSAGSLAGVQRFSPVVAPEGLVGVVDNVDPTISHAMVWTHPDFRVSAMSVSDSAAPSAFGIVQAHVDNGPGRYLMEMRGVPFRTPIKPGTMIVSSGYGGVYPSGIPIGRVIGETKTTETWARTYLIRPAVFPADVYSVMILQPERVAKGLQNVWEVGTGLDTSQKKIVLAGDSLTRMAALAEARARQAAQDSATRDSLRAAGGGVTPAAPMTAADSAALRAARARRDSVRRDSLRRDTLARRDSARVPTHP